MNKILETSKQANVNALNYFKNFLEPDDNKSEFKLKNEKNENLNKEAEIKAFLWFNIENWIFNEEDNDKQTKSLEKKLKAKNAEIIFDWIIEDTRYDNKYLKDNWINIIRVRHIIWKKLNNWKIENVDEYLLTVKSRWENKFEVHEFEKEYTKEELDKIMEENDLFPTRKYKKYRTEYKSNISDLESNKSKRNIKKNNYQNKDENVKFAFDKYLNYTEKEILEEKKNNWNWDIVLKNYWKIPKFVEIESEKWVEAVKKTTEVLWLENTALTLKWVRELLNYFEFKDKLNSIDFEESKIDKNKYDKKIKKHSRFYNQFIKYILDDKIFINNELFTTIDKIKNNEDKKKLISNTKKISLFLTVSIKESLKRLINENPKYIDFFEDFFEKDNNLEFNEKFYKKINRYLPWFEIAISNSIKKHLENYDKLDEYILEDIIKKQITKFLELLFIFWNNLNRKQFEKLLNVSSVKNENEFEQLKLKIDKLSKDENPNSLLTSKILRNCYSELYFDNNKNSNNKLKNKNLEQKLEEHIVENFGMLSKSFNIWLNSPKENENKSSEFILNLEKNFLDIFDIILILKKNNIAFTSFDWMRKENVLDKILEDSKFKEILSSIENCSLWDIEWWIELEQSLFKKFLEWLNSEDKNKAITKIKKDYLDFNEWNINKISSKKVKYWEKDITIQDFEEIVKNQKEFDLSKISYDLWKTSPYALRLKIYIKYILKSEEKHKEIYSEITEYDEKNTNNKKITSFIKIEYSKVNNINNIDEIDMNSSNFKNYKSKILKQIKESYNVFTNTNENKEDYIKLFETNKNDSDLLVAWLRFSFKFTQKDKENKNIKDLHISSENFLEQIVYNVDKNKIKADLIIWTSDAQTTSGWYTDYMNKKHNHSIEKWLVQIDKSFYIKNSDNTKTFFKDKEDFYLPNSGTKDFLDIKNYILEGLDLCTQILNWNFVNKNTNYYKQLEKINFSFNDITMISKLKEFLKYSIDILDTSNKMLENSKMNQAFFEKIDDSFKEKLNLNNDEISIWDLKLLDRVFAKNMSKYSGHLSKIWDINRMMIVKDSFEELTTSASDFIELVWNFEEVTQIWIEDNIWNIFEKAKKNSWYRDAKMTLVLKNWNTIEVQFQLKEYLNIKHNWIKLDNYLENKINDELSFFEKENNRKTFSKKEQNEIINECKNKNDKIKFPKNFYINILWIDKEDSILDWIILKDDDKLVDDYLYNLSRISIEWTKIKEKIEKIQNVLYDIAGWKAAKKEVEKVLS